jgi:hypothetical protein
MNTFEWELHCGLEEFLKEHGYNASGGWEVRVWFGESFKSNLLSINATKDGWEIHPVNFFSDNHRRLVPYDHPFEKVVEAIESYRLPKIT